MKDENLGKVTYSLFADLLGQNFGLQRNEVIAGPQFGVDVSLVELSSDMAMALTSDPLSLIPTLGLQESAWLSVHLMANDIATTGFAPMYGQFVLNLPPSLSLTDLKVYWDFIHRFCLEIKVAITGGHTCFAEGQHSTIAGGGTFITIGHPKKMLLSKFAQPGNALLMTKSCAIASASILAMSFPKTVKNKAGSELYKLACESFYHTSSLQDALIAMEVQGHGPAITAMHDVTEGGALGAICEMAIASDNGAIIYNHKLPVEPVQEAICSIFDLDPKTCIGAGAMIIACKEEFMEAVITRLGRNNIPCVEVGKLCEKEEGIRIIENGTTNKWKPGTEDPYWAAFDKAIKSGWK